MHPSFLEAHATPNHENGDRAPCNAPSTRQHPLTPAKVSGSPAVSCSEYRHAHETKDNKREKGPKVPRQMNGNTKKPLLKCKINWKKQKTAENVRTSKKLELSIANMEFVKKAFKLIGGHYNMTYGK